MIVFVDPEAPLEVRLRRRRPSWFWSRLEGAGLFLAVSTNIGVSRGKGVKLALTLTSRKPTCGVFLGVILQFVYGRALNLMVDCRVVIKITDERSVVRNKHG